MKPGDKLVTANSIVDITSLEEYNGNERYTLTTEDGTALVQDVLVSTICEQNLPEGR